MLGRKSRQPKLFYGFSIEDSVRQDDFYRKLEKAVDLSWVTEKVAHCYSDIGRPSIDPEVFVKIELIAYLEGITFERELMRQIHDRLSLRRYIGYDIDEAVPDHSTISKLRDLLGEELIQEIMDFSVRLCKAAGMVGGIHVSADRTLMRANASLDKSLEPRIVHQTPEQFVRQVFAENPVTAEEPEVRAAVISLLERPGYPTPLPLGPEVPIYRALVPEAEPVNPDASAQEQCEPRPVEDTTRPAQDTTQSAQSQGKASPAGGQTALNPGEESVHAEAAEDKIETQAADAQSGGERPEDEANSMERQSGAKPAEEKSKPIAGKSETKSATDKTKSKRKGGRPAPTNATHVSRTDPDAKITRRPDVPAMLAYSGEFFTDSRCGVITFANGWPATVAEHETVMTALCYQRTELDLPVAVISADRGYGVGRLYRDLKAEDVVAFIPHHKNEPPEGMFTLDQFKYDAEKEAYRCPNGCELQYAGVKVEWPRVRHVFRAQRNDCTACPQRAKCTKAAGNGGRELKISAYQPEYEEMDRRLGGQGGHLAAVARRVGPEPRFGQGKRWQGLGQAKYRGLAKVRGQVLLTAAAQNFKKYVRWIYRKGSGVGKAKMLEARQNASSLSVVPRPLQLGFFNNL